MADKWEWDTFEEINNERRKLNIPFLGWCCKLELNIRGSCGGQYFDSVPPMQIQDALAEIQCPHWTSPENIANKLIHKTKGTILVYEYKSGAIVICNDNRKTYVTLGYSKNSPISWKELLTTYHHEYPWERIYHVPQWVLSHLNANDFTEMVRLHEWPSRCTDKRLYACWRHEDNRFRFEVYELYLGQGDSGYEVYRQRKS